MGQSEISSLKVPRSHLMAALSSATLHSLEQDAQRESWRPFPGICIEDIGVKVERDPIVRYVYRKTVVDHDKFQRARRYCSNMLSNGLFDWRGQEYQLRHIPREDQIKSTATRSIPDDDSGYMRHDIESGRGQSFTNTGSFSNYTSNTSNHKLSMQESAQAHTDHRSLHNEPFIPTAEENRNASNATEVEETEDEDKLMVPARELLTARNKNEETKAEGVPLANICLERSPELKDPALENTSSPPTATLEIMSEILSWTRSTVSDDLPYLGQQLAASPISTRPQLSSPVLSPRHNMYGSTQEQLDILFKDAPSPSPKSLLGSEDWLELGSDVE
ncbi:hypothetical protein BG006_005541 [Podila minutissima]|uniref:Uncharacterized protein n=1 Tax=Podila minutissima TaxID=64525 RepID=A0A9P5SMG2_9FUNG|nr:hypothetical protein BG006_005541 [Podila minutissima]